MAEEKKKRRGRRAYLDDFKKTASGEYVYTGQTHPYHEDNSLPRKQALLRLWVPTVVMAAAVVTAGCIPAAGPSHIPYVILPYLASLLAAASVVWLMCRLTAGGDPLPDYVHAATVKQFGLRGTLALVCSAAALVCEGIYLALNGAGDRLAGSIGFLVCEGVAALCALWWKISTQKLRW